MGASSTFVLLLGALASSVVGQSAQSITTPAWPARSSSVPMTWPNPYANHTGPKPHENPNTSSNNASDSNNNYTPSYSPARGPALPLAVRSPYTSAWTSTASNGTLNSDSVIFWDGSALGWEGIATVDGISYEWMGIGSRDLPKLPNLISALPQSVAYDSQYTNFTFQAGPVEIYASFFSPVIPQDLCRTSVPLSYLTVNAKSLDNSTHNVSLYTDVNGAWVTQPSAPLTWEIYDNGASVNGTSSTGNGTSDTASDSIYTWVVQLQDQYVFGENFGQSSSESGNGVFPLWGNFTFSSSQGSAQSIAYQSGPAVDQRFHYVMGSALDDVVDTDYRAYDQAEPVFAYQHQLGMVGSAGCEEPILFTIGSVVQPAIRLLTPEGLESLQPWWSKCFGDFWSMLTTHYKDFATVSGLGAAFEQKLKDDIAKYYSKNSGSTNTPTYGNGTVPGDTPPFINGTRKLLQQQRVKRQSDQSNQQIIFDSADAYGWLEPPNDCNVTSVADPDAQEAQSYYSVVALAARQVMMALELTLPSVTSKNQNDPLLFLKEISSSGNVNTVDVIFPAMPFFLWANPNLLRYVLEPLYYNQEMGFYPNKYAMHDVGARFPNATGHLDGSDEYMPVEESGNMILMTYGIYKFTNDAAYLQSHYKILQQWAQYLIDYSLIPAEQLSTDDFAGTLANQTNLAIKGIVGLAAMGEISKAVGDSSSAASYSSTAADYFKQWTTFGIDPSGKHTLLAYQWRSSWGLLYNVYPAKLFGLDIIPQSIYDMQSAFYPTVSQLWGVPLDNRHYWTKSDWELWTAAYCQPSTRALFVNALGYWLNTTSADLPFTDLYQTVHTGEGTPSPTFLARPVQGGLFSLLALLAGGTA